MSTQPNEKLNAQQLAQVSGGDGDGHAGTPSDQELSTISGEEDGEDNPGTDPSTGALSDTDLSKVSGGTDGGFRHEYPPNVGPKEGLI